MRKARLPTSGGEKKSEERGEKRREGRREERGEERRQKRRRQEGRGVNESQICSLATRFKCNKDQRSRNQGIKESKSQKANDQEPRTKKKKLKKIGEKFSKQEENL